MVVHAEAPVIDIVQRRRQRKERRRQRDSSSEELHHRGRRDFDGYGRRHYSRHSKHISSWEYGEASTPRRRYPSPAQGRNSIRRKHLDFDSYGNCSDSGRSEPRGYGRKVKQEVITTTADESRKRRERRHRQKEVELERRARERQGLRGHFLSVSDTGIPYGHGVGAWRNELTKLCMALNPTVMDIRWQPEDDMKLLKLRLSETFEYSDEVCDKHIRKLAGCIVSQRRSKLWHIQRQGGSCPVGLDEGIWRTLDRIRKNPEREELSQQKKYANSCRRNVGRTGPKGETGTREELKIILGRDPDPSELQEEMRRDKGYTGVSKKRKATAIPLTPSSSAASSDSNYGDSGSIGAGIKRGEETLSEVREKEKKDKTVPQVEDKDKEAGGGPIDLDYVRKLEEEVAALRKQTVVTPHHQTMHSVNDGGPSLQNSTQNEGRNSNREGGASQKVSITVPFFVNYACFTRRAGLGGICETILEFVLQGKGAEGGDRGVGSANEIDAQRGPLTAQKMKLKATRSSKRQVLLVSLLNLQTVLSCGTC